MRSPAPRRAFSEILASTAAGGPQKLKFALSPPSPMLVAVGEGRRGRVEDRASRWKFLYVLSFKIRRATVRGA